MTIERQNKLVFWSFLCLFVYSLVYELIDAWVSASNFFGLIYISIICLVTLFVRTSWKRDIPPNALLLYDVLLIWNLVCFVRGMFASLNYFDWKNVLTDPGGGLSLAVPLAIIVGVNYLSTKRLLKLIITLFKFSILLIPASLFIFSEIYSRLVTPVVVFILFIPYLKKRERVVVFLVAILSAVLGLSWRANILHISISFLILFIYYFRMVLSRSFITVLQVASFVLPIYFIYQGIQGESIFAKSATISSSPNESAEVQDLTADTRTDLYTDVFKDLKQNQKLWLGKGANAKYKAQEDFDLLAFLGDERPSVEVGFLKTLLYTGIIGVLIYSILIIMAVYYGTCRTNNTLTVLLATFLASHWVILFIENIINYDMYFYMSWICVGLCFSESFRNLTDTQIKRWFYLNI